jgi:hypothetical protein
VAGLIVVYILIDVLAKVWLIVTVTDQPEGLRLAWIGRRDLVIDFLKEAYP